MFSLKNSICAGILLLAFQSFGHQQEYDKMILREWQIKGKSDLWGSLMLLKNGEVFIETNGKETVHIPLTDLSEKDQQYVLHRYQNIQKLNKSLQPVTSDNHSPIHIDSISKIILSVCLLILILFVIYFWFGRNHLNYVYYFFLIGLTAILYSFQSRSLIFPPAPSDPVYMDSAFSPYKPNVVTSWDNNYFYVESYGIPTTHNMMKGIVSWQQQVPIPQCYIKPNAWMIPLNPVIAPNPIPVDSIHFTRGAIAVAVNGIPIFNYHTNTGVDALLDGQLDEWGGHCGRADDYHYHVAPMQLYGNTSPTLPIAFGLDGFAVYGNVEPDGSLMNPLDANNGHFGSNGVYHYHGKSTAPYMIGRMVGRVAEDTTHQIVPQPHAQPVRPAQNPLKGAVITECIPKGNNGYKLIYTLNGNIDSIVYSWTKSGVYSFNFFTNSGNTTAKYNGFIPCQLPVSVREIPLDSEIFELFPNPAHDEIRITLNNSIRSSEIRNLRLVNDKGIIIYYKNKFEEILNTENLPKGIYFVILSTSARQFIKKIIIQ